MTFKTLTVVIPCFDEEATLETLVGRVLDADACGLDKEIIIVDDGSNDDLKGALAHFRDLPITLLHHQTRQGAGAARNTGVKASRGDYIALLDSDDEWLPGKLDHQLAFLRSRNGEIGLLCSGYILTWDETGRQETRHPQSCATYRRLLMGCDLSPGSTLFAERLAFDEVGLFDEALERLEDWDWLLRYLRTSRIDVIPEPMVRIHLSPRPPTRHGSTQYQAPLQETSRLDHTKQHCRFPEIPFQPVCGGVGLRLL